MLRKSSTIKEPGTQPLFIAHLFNLVMNCTQRQNAFSPILEFFSQSVLLLCDRSFLVVFQTQFAEESAFQKFKKIPPITNFADTILSVKFQCRVVWNWDITVLKQCKITPFHAKKDRRRVSLRQGVKMTVCTDKEGRHKIRYNEFYAWSQTTYTMINWSIRK